MWFCLFKWMWNITNSHTDVLRVQCDSLHDSKVKGKQWPGTSVSETQSCHRNRNGKQPKLQIDKIQREHTFNKMSSSFQKGGHSDTWTLLKLTQTHRWKQYRNWQQNKRHRESQQKYSLGTVSNIIILGGGGGGGGGGLNRFNGLNLRFCCGSKHLVSCLDGMVNTLTWRCINGQVYC